MDDGVPTFRGGYQVNPAKMKTGILRIGLNISLSPLAELLQAFLEKKLHFASSVSSS
jgi:hypothetical protein